MEHAFNRKKRNLNQLENELENANLKANFKNENLEAQLSTP